MTTEQIANKLVALCREGKYDQVYKELYAPDVQSIEPDGGTWEQVSVGMDAIYKKAKQWHEMVQEFHSGEISDPIVADNFFAVTMKSRVSLKGASEPINMDEVCVYKVENGKVVCEQFFYSPMVETV